MHFLKKDSKQVNMLIDIHIAMNNDVGSLIFFVGRNSFGVGRISANRCLKNWPNRAGRMDWPKFRQPAETILPGMRGQSSKR